MTFPLSRRREPSPSLRELATGAYRDRLDAHERASLALGWLFAVEPTDRALAGWQGAQDARVLFPAPTEESEAA